MEAHRRDHADPGVRRWWWWVSRSITLTSGGSTRGDRRARSEGSEWVARVWQCDPQRGKISLTEPSTMDGEEGVPDRIRDRLRGKGQGERLTVEMVRRRWCSEKLLARCPTARVAQWSSGGKLGCGGFPNFQVNLELGFLSFLFFNVFFNICLN